MKKTLLALCVASLAAGSAQAQLFRPSIVEGALLGGAAGAIIGHNSDRRGGEGAAIGAVAGALIGAALDQRSQTRTVVVAPPPAPVACAPQQVTYVYEQPACPPPPPRQVVVYYPPQPVVVYSGYGYAPRPRRVVYANAWGSPWSCGPEYGHGRWR